MSIPDKDDHNQTKRIWKKMNSSKTKKLVLVATIVIIGFWFIPNVQGKQPSTSIRPIEDWFFGNPFGGSPGYADPDSMRAQRCLATVPEADSYEGEIIETYRKDKSILLTVTLSVSGMPMALRDLTAVGTDEEWFFVGVMDFTFEAHLILEKHVPGGDLLDWDFGPLVTDNKGEPAPLIVPFGHLPSGPRNPGDFLPAWWLVYFYPTEIGGHYVYEDFVSEGFGNYIQPGWNPFTSEEDPVLKSETANVECHQQVFISEDFDVNDPDVYQWTSWTVPYGVFKDGGILRQSPLLMPEKWPYEFINIY